MKKFVIILMSIMLGISAIAMAGCNNKGGTNQKNSNHNQTTTQGGVDMNGTTNNGIGKGNGVINGAELAVEGIYYNGSTENHFMVTSEGKEYNFEKNNEAIMPSENLIGKKVKITYFQNADGKLVPSKIEVL